MRTVLVAAAVLLAAGGIAAEIVYPGDDFVPGWKTAGQTLRFVKNDLYGYIDGGAELFHEYGFEDLLVQHYVRGEDEISLEVYRMASPESALGIYLIRCGTETPVQGVPVRNSGGWSQIAAVKGGCFIQVNNFMGDEDLLPVMVELVSRAATSVPEAEPVLLLDSLPREGLVPGTELIVRGPYSLQMMLTFGKGDVLELGSEIFGVAGDYRDSAGVVFTRIVIPYPNAGTARHAFESLVANLDPYLTVEDAWQDGFTFRDYQDKFGEATVAENVISIRIHLPATPARPVLQR
ncbi:MAG TPA: DUF6599 family protein [Acidobacteriota bacterium]|nr:DUF6599 family protein [Acidobacteriota bacterium]